MQMLAAPAQPSQDAAGGHRQLQLLRTGIRPTAAYIQMHGSSYRTAGAASDSAAMRQKKVWACVQLAPVLLVAGGPAAAGRRRGVAGGRRAFENELGVQPPCGFWDPMGFTDDGDMAAYQRRRSVEFKHGRIAMLATMGYITPEVAGHWPGYLSPSLGLKFADVPGGLAALPVVPGWAQILIYFMLVEYTAGFEDYRSGTPGDYGWKVLTSDDPAERKRKLNADLANGRLAMVAVMAMLFQNGLAGTTGPAMWIPGA